MLYKETVYTRTLELLKTLMCDPILSDFFLVGGTALSLQIGHRKSIDLDLFIQNDFNENEVLSHIETKYGFQVEAYHDKYATRNPVMAIKSLVYHYDIDFTEPIEMMDKNYSWTNIEKRLKDMINRPDLLFPALNKL